MKQWNDSDQRRLDPEETRKAYHRAQAVTSRVLRNADPSIRKEAVLTRDRERVMALITIAENEGESEVTYHCSGCGCVIEGERVAWHRMHGRVRENH